jgi:lysophospholipase L1-like esterase
VRYTVQAGQTLSIGVPETGGTLANLGAGTVSYGPTADRALGASTLAAGASVTLSGVVYVYTAARAELEMTPTAAAASTSGTASAGKLRLGGWWAGNGDSMTVGQDGVASSPFEQVCMQSGGRIQRLGNTAVGGTDTSQALARFDTDLAALGRVPDVWLMWLGYNDIGATGFTPAVTQANIEAIADRCAALGITLILPTLVGRINQSTAPKLLQTAQTNLVIRGIGSRKNVRVIDLATILNDPTTGLVKTAYNLDNTHLNALGGRIAGQAILTALAGDLPTWSVPLADSSVDATNLLVNPLLFDGNADSKPDSWTVNVTPGVTVITDSDILGSAVSIAQAAAGSGKNVYQDVTVASGKFAVGDRMALSGRFKILGGEAGPLAASYLRAAFVGSSSGLVYGSGDWVGDVANGVVYREFVVPGSGTTAIRFAIQAGTGTGTVVAGQLALRNLTALAAAGVSY